MPYFHHFGCGQSLFLACMHVAPLHIRGTALTQLKFSPHLVPLSRLPSKSICYCSPENRRRNSHIPRASDADVCGRQSNLGCGLGWWPAERAGEVEEDSGAQGRAHVPPRGCMGVGDGGLPTLKSG
jgi:hypothetical protein